jgi:hypothetical protein
LRNSQIEPVLPYKKLKNNHSNLTLILPALKGVQPKHYLAEMNAVWTEHKAVRVVVGWCIYINK